jgi:hypothetical protein
VAALAAIEAPVKDLLFDLKEASLIGEIDKK